MQRICPKRLPALLQRLRATWESWSSHVLPRFPPALTHGNMLKGRKVVFRPADKSRLHLYKGVLQRWASRPRSKAVPAYHFESGPALVDLLQSPPRNELVPKELWLRGRDVQRPRLHHLTAEEMGPLEAHKQGSSDQLDSVSKAVLGLKYVWTPASAFSDCLYPRLLSLPDGPRVRVDGRSPLRTPL